MSEFPVVRYASVAPDVTAEFDLSLLSEVTRIAGQAGRFETGGILIGEYFDQGTAVRITEITTMPSDSLFGRSWFKRGRKGLDAILRDRWKQGQHYIGEWHSHPGGSPEPSEPDISAMRRIATDPLYQCKSPVLLVVGGNPPGSFSISVTALVSGSPQRLRYGVPMWPRQMSRR